MAGFAKIYQSIYDGSLRDNWEALVTFQQFLILADPEGNVDMTIRAIHHRTGIPERVLTQGIKVLTTPDTQSRTPTDDGRRLKCLDVHRNWGWVIVNYVIYRASPDPTNAERKRRWRDSKTTTSEGDGNAYHSVPSASLSASDTPRDGECEGQGVPTAKPCPDPAETPSMAEVVDYADRIGLVAWKAEMWWREMESVGWQFKGQRVQKWRPLVTRLKTFWEADGRPMKPTGRPGKQGEGKIVFMP